MGANDRMPSHGETLQKRANKNRIICKFSAQGWLRAILHKDIASSI